MIDIQESRFHTYCVWADVRCILISMIFGLRGIVSKRVKCDVPQSESRTLEIPVEITSELFLFIIPAIKNFIKEEQ
jgi:hypothetical protein